VAIIARAGRRPEDRTMSVCQRCQKPATVHLTEISNGKPTEIHMCDACAQEAGYVQAAHVPINELLDQFLKAHAQMADTQTTRCPDCGMTWQEFKDTGLLGCSKDYQLFEAQLQGVIERAQQGANHHTGKLPTAKAPAALAEDAVKLRQAELSRLRKELARAVEDESYETAARLRDQIKKMETL
jgi:protein arginine kinase activator